MPSVILIYARHKEWPMGYSTVTVNPPTRKWIRRWSAFSTIAAVIAVLSTYFVLWLWPGIWLRAFFLERGITQPITLSICLTVVFYCSLRQYLIKKEFKAAKKSWLLDSDDYTINTNQSLRESIRLLSNSSCISANRQQRVLSFFVNSKSRSIARELSQDDADSTGIDIDNAYIIIRIMIWTMPMLGFLGTVLGISISISGFSGLLSGVSDLASVKTGLSQVTAGLSTAFDTTLLGIVCAIVCTFLASVCERNEQSLAQYIEEIVNDDLLPRLI